MKKITFIAIIALFFNAETNAQKKHPEYLFEKDKYFAVNEPVLSKTKPVFTNDSTTVIDRDYYLAKSKSQKTAAWILLGGGAGLIGTGFLIGNRETSTFGEAGTGVVIGGLGLLSIIASIPVFNASVKNKKKAKLAVSQQKTMLGFPVNVSKNITGLTLSIPIGK